MEQICNLLNSARLRISLQQMSMHFDILSLLGPNRLPRSLIRTNKSTDVKVFVLLLRMGSTTGYGRSKWGGYEREKGAGFKLPIASGMGRRQGKDSPVQIENDFVLLDGDPVDFDAQPIVVKGLSGGDIEFPLMPGTFQDVPLFLMV